MALPGILQFVDGGAELSEKREEVESTFIYTKAGLLYHSTEDM